MAEDLQGENSLGENYLKFLPLGLFFVGLFFLSVAAGLFFFKNSNGSSEIEILSASSLEQKLDEIVVHIDGAVTKPGVYSLPAGSRITKAVEAAGGLTVEADGSKLNLAAKVGDGQKVHIPAVGEVRGTTGVTGTTGGTSIDSGLIDINIATEAQLDKLPQIGPVTAAKIIASRPYSSLEDLLVKKAVSTSVYEKIKDLITF